MEPMGLLSQDSATSLERKHTPIRRKELRSDTRAVERFPESGAHREEVGGLQILRSSLREEPFPPSALLLRQRHHDILRETNSSESIVKKLMTEGA
jgi:hypothetical protein